MYENKVWTLVDLPNDRQAIENKWIIKKKTDVDGNVTVYKAQLLESLDYESLDACEPCLMGKMTKTPFSGTMERETDLLEIIHTDVCGPMSVEARGGYR